MNAWEQLKYKLREKGFIYSDLLPVALGAYVSRVWPGEPLWVLVIGAPSSGKTTAALMLRGFEDAIVISSLTPASLITAHGGVENDRSLMARLDKQMLVIKDFGTILSMGWECMAQILATLREAFDGYVSKDFAMLRREYRLKFGCIAVSTPVADNHSHLSQQLGERFVKFRPKPVILPHPLKPIDEDAHELVKEYISNLDIPVNAPLPSHKLVTHAAEIVVHLRTIPLHNWNAHEITDIPDFESPHRFERQLNMLWAGVYVVTGDAKLANNLMLKAALDSVPTQRLRLFSILYREPWTGVNNITEQLRIGEGTVRTIVDDMLAMGLIESRRREPLWPKAYEYRVPLDLASFIEETFGHI